MIGLVLVVAEPAAAQEVVECADRGLGSGLAQAKLDLERVNGEPVTGIVTMPFDDRRSPKSLLFEYRVEGCVFPEDAVNTPLDGIEFFEPRDRGGDELTARIRVNGEIKSPQIVVVNLDLDPSDGHASPGTFRTGFAITDTRFDLFRQDVVATLRYAPSSILILTILVPVVIFGSFLVWAKGRAGGSKESFFTWGRKLGNIFAVVAGIAAILAYFELSVFADEDFGRQLYENSMWQWVWQPDWFRTVAGAGSAFVTAVLGFSLAGDRARGGTDDDGVSGRAGRFGGDAPNQHEAVPPEPVTAGPG
jgi:hypothetical protein